jgi:membrane-bound serine protease (ClpP class)
MCSAAAFLASAALISRHLGSIPILSRLALRPAADAGEAVAAISPDGKPRGVSPSDQLTSMEVGDWGVAATALRPAGKARFGDHLVDVITDGRFVERGQQVRIVKVQGNGITVSEVG